MDIDFIIPCYNPEPSWEENLLCQFAELHKLIPQAYFHIFIIDDGSHFSLGITKPNQDLEFLKISIIKNTKNKGKGYSLRKGVENAQSPLIIYTDSDFPYTPASVYKVIKALSGSSPDLVIGKRNEQYYQQIPKGRKLVSKLLRQLNKAILATEHTDTQVGLKGFKARGKKLFLETTTDRFLIDLEFIKKASKQKLEIKAVSVFLRDNIKLSEVKTSTLIKELGSFIKILASR